MVPRDALPERPKAKRAYEEAASREAGRKEGGGVREITCMIMGTAGGVDPLWTQCPPSTSGNTPSSVFWKLLCAQEMSEVAGRQGFSRRV